MGIAIKKTIDCYYGWFETAQRAELDRHIHADHLRGKAFRRKPVVVVESVRTAVGSETYSRAVFNGWV